MVHIISQPYEKKYVFPLFSATFLLRLILIIITITAPFFIVYNSGSFYQNKKTSVIDLSQVNLKPNYQYYIKLETQSQSYIYTNFWTNTAYQAINIKFLQKTRSQLGIKVQFIKQTTNKVKSIQVFVGFEYVKRGQKNFGLIKAQAKGYDLSQAVIAGNINFQSGKGTKAILTSDNILRANQFNFPLVFQSFYKSSNFLTFKYNTLPISLPSDLFQLNLSINYPVSMVQQNTPSIFGQLIWSWIQYFPILIVIYWLTDQIWKFMLKEGLVKRNIVHDKDYLQILRKQQDRLRNNRQRVQ